jgi:hypothetical protein
MASEKEKNVDLWDKWLSEHLDVSKTFFQLFRSNMIDTTTPLKAFEAKELPEPTALKFYYDYGKKTGNVWLDRSENADI